MNGREFWVRWRHDIVRGAVIFSFVVAIGLVAQSMVSRGRHRLDGLRETFNPDFFAADRQRATSWIYAVPVASHRTLWVRNFNGSITVEPAEGPKVEVEAVRTFKHSAADSVRILTSETGQGMTVCAIWPGKSSQCGPDGHYSVDGELHGNDVAVLFTVRLPRGVNLDASTVNGDVEVSGSTAAVGVATVNGDVTVETTSGAAKAHTVNGDARVVLGGATEAGQVSVATVRGDATVELPPELDAVVDGHTVTGDISTDFPLTIAGKFASRSISGTLGRGGRQIRLNTVAGDVEVRKLGPTSPVPPIPPVPPRGRAPRSPGSP